MINDRTIDLLDLLSAYRAMVRIRMFEEQVAELLDTGEIVTPCHLAIGQEAIPAGVCAALRADDYIWGGHRSHGHYLAKGGDLRAMMIELYGRLGGCSHGRGGSMHLIALDVGLLGTVPLVAATIPLAVGSALASRLRGEDRVSVAFFGDGATEEGHFHESLNMASHQKLPVLFVCENNFYSSHMGLLERRARDNIYASGAAHGMHGEVLDGNDINAVYVATAAAVERARSGEGPTLLECKTFRWRGHVGSSWDLDVGVRRKEELDEWMPRDPIARAHALLVASGVSDDEFARTTREIQAEIAAAVDAARAAPEPPANTVLDHVFYTN